MARNVNIKYERWMTPRDRQMILSVYKHGILNSRQIELLHFNGSKNSRIIALRRLKKLVDNNFLKQHWYGYNRQGTMQHFTLTNKGAMIASSLIDIPAADIRINEAGILSNIEHSSLIADFHINLINNGFIVPLYSCDKLNRTEFIYNGRSITFEPDAKGIAIKNKSDRKYPFFLEMDRGTMSYNYFKLKIPNYEAYYASKKYLKEFDAFPLVFIVTTTRQRLMRMKEIIEDVKKSDINYLLTTINESEFIGREIFEIAGREGKYKLK